MNANLYISDDFVHQKTVAYVGLHADLAALESGPLLPEGLSPSIWKRLVGNKHPGDRVRTGQTLLDGPTERVFVCVLPQIISRYNTPSRALSIPGFVKTLSGDSVSLLALVPTAQVAEAVAIAIAKGLHTFGLKSQNARPFYAHFRSPQGPLPLESHLTPVVNAVRVAAHLTDMPPNLLTPTSFIETLRQFAVMRPSIQMEVISGDALKEQGFNGVHSVGKAALDEPALVRLSYKNDPSTSSCTAWVGKGITYDTGGLSLKSKTGMVSMKRDMGGAAAVFSAFMAAVKQKRVVNLHAILCIAENAIGPAALKPDDIITLRSGKTVEVNNTDAEGRLVLADGVAWATEQPGICRIIDVATLTGAQPVSTGKDIAAIYSSSESLEHQLVAGGKRSGELCHPLPYLPEVFKNEFTSAIANMKNSVKNRANGQSACAAQFIANHLGSYDGEWAHIDLCGPSWSNGRATGFGVGLLLSTL